MNPSYYWQIWQNWRNPAARRSPPAPPPPRDHIAAGFRYALPWLMFSLGVSMSALVGQVPIWTLIVFGACAAWRQWSEHRRIPLPSLLVRLVIFLPTTAGVLHTYGTNPGAAGMLTFLVALLALKILELRSHRDFIVVGLLGYFMTLSAFFYNQGLALSLYLGLAVITNTVALIRCHDGGRRYARRAALRLALILLVQAIPLVILLFVIFPRVQGNFLRGLNTSQVGKMGMSDHLQPGAFAGLLQSNDIAFRVALKSGELSTRNLYWRGLVLGVCEAPLSWRASDASFYAGPPKKPAAGGRRIEQKVTIMRQEEKWLFGLDRPGEVKPGSSLKPVLGGGDILRSTLPITSNSLYTVYSDLNPVADQDLSPNERAFFTRLPSHLSPRVMALVEKWKLAANGKTGAAWENTIIAEARLFFRDGEFTYTLNPGVLPPKTGFDRFLFQTRRGFCEHYAAAFSTLMRAAGLPARVVVGYQGGEYNPWGAHYTVHQSDAHAWSEIWITGHGWQREDPTAVVAPERVSFGAESYESLTADGPLTAESRLERLTRLNSPGTLRWILRTSVLAWDGVDQQWNLLVLGYDRERQADALQDLGLGNLNWVEGAMLALTASFSVLALVGLAVRVLERANPGQADAAARLYETFCGRVAKVAGVSRAPAEGPLDFSRRATRAFPAQARQIGAITDLYVLSRYAEPVHADLASRTLEALQNAVEQFRRAGKPELRPEVPAAPE